MSQPEAPNPESRSNGALICLGLGGLLLVLAWVLGVGGVLATAAAGGDPAAMAGGIGALIALPLTMIAGLILVLVGGVWMFARVVADSREGADKERYTRDVQR
ncbi:MAG: hypothetical protein AB7P07_09180 [Hyphomonadaceae bacterium]